MAIIYQKTPPTVVTEVINPSVSAVLEKVDVKEDVTETEISVDNHDIEDEQEESEDVISDPADNSIDTNDISLGEQKMPEQNHVVSKHSFNNNKKKKR